MTKYLQDEGRAIPASLKTERNWLLWKMIQKPGHKKPSKVPFYVSGKPRSGEQGSASDRSQMATFDEAVAACTVGNFDGVGIALFDDLGIVALDFDNCVTDCVVTVPFIAELALETYCEFSPSGKGIRAFMRGTLPDRKDTHSVGAD